MVGWVDMTLMVMEVDMVQHTQLGASILHTVIVVIATVLPLVIHLVTVVILKYYVLYVFLCNT